MKRTRLMALVMAAVMALAIALPELADEAVTSRLEKDNVTILKGHVTD